MSVGSAAQIARLAALFAHPLRIRLLAALVAEGRGSATAFSDQFGDVTVGDCHYHLKVLSDGGVIELDHSRRVRGATERVYRLASWSRWRGSRHFRHFVDLLRPAVGTGAGLGTKAK